MANKPQILFFHIESDKAKQIEAVCRSLSIRTVKVKPSSYNQKLGYLAGITGFNRENSAYQGAELPSEMMVFSGMDSDMVDIFLAKYKEASIPPIRLKAILTPHNIFWSAADLYSELLREHQEFLKH